jgi:3-oxoacyl-(acyl-carrier-protein) synthase
MNTAICGGCGDVDRLLLRSFDMLEATSTINDDTMPERRKGEW